MKNIYDILFRKPNKTDFLIVIIISILGYLLVHFGIVIHNDNLKDIVVFCVLLISLCLNTIIVLRWKYISQLNKAYISTENALKESEKKYRTLVESLLEGIGIVDENENFTFVNNAGCAIFGCTNNDLVGKNLKEFTTEREFENIQSKTENKKKGNMDIYELEITGCDNITKTILVKTSPVIEDGVFKGAFGFFSDITEQKKYEEKREQMIIELENKLSNGEKIANGFLPICASCHKIRDKENNWHSVSDYLSIHTNLQFTHTVCPECKIEIYGPDKN